MVTGTLRELAQKAHLEAEAERNKIKETERTRKQQLIERKLSKLFSEKITTTLTENDHQQHPIIAADDIRFSMHGFGDVGEELVLIGTCPDCKKDAHSEALRTLADVGETLNQFTVATDHHC